MVKRTGSELAGSKSSSDCLSLLLIGPGKHFGFEIAARFAREGFSIGIVSRNKLPIASEVLQLRNQGHRIEFSQADVTDTASLQRALSELSSILPPVACVVYNAKASISKSELRENPELLTHSLAVNVTGALSTATFLQCTRKRPLPVTLIISGGGFKDKPDSRRLALSVGKAALHNLSMALAPELQTCGISVKTIVIDGEVGREGPLQSSALADMYWHAYNNKSQVSFDFPPRSSRALPLSPSNNER